MAAPHSTGSQQNGTPPQQNGATSPGSVSVRLHGWPLAAVLISLMLTLLLAALDQTIVSTALPKIIGELQGFDRYTWVVTAYLLAETTVIPIIGKLSDQFGRKWFLIAGVVIFLIGSALSGASRTMNQLIIFRGLQGVGAGFLFALIFTLIGDIFSPAERARWQGLFSAVFALASVVGPTLGGWITDNTTWRWVFYVNLPLGLIALVMLFFRLPNTISARSTHYTGWAAIRRIDVAGAVAAAGATVCLLLGLSWGGQTYPWNSAQVIGTLAGSVLLYVAFFFIERSVAEPILPLDLFKNQIFATGALISLIVSMAFFAVVIYLPLFIQIVLGQSATSSGAAITPLTVTMALGSTVVGQIIYKVGRYQVISILGTLILTAGVFLLTRLSDVSALGTVTLFMVVVGLGLGLVLPVLTLAVQNAIPRPRLGVGTSAVTYLRTTGQMLGVALIGTIVNNTITSELAARLPPQAKQLPPAVLAAASSQQVLSNPQAKATLIDDVTRAAVAHAPPQEAGQVTAQVHTLLNQVFEASRQSLGVGIQHAFFASLIICVVVVIITFFLKDAPLTSRVEVPAAPSGKAGRLPSQDGGATSSTGEQTQQPAGPPQVLSGRASTPDDPTEDASE